MSTDDILETWPYYRKPTGYRLVDMDFQQCFENRNGMLTKWDEYYFHILHFLSRDGHIKDKYIKGIVENLNQLSDLSENGKNAGILWCLHGYFVPTKLVVTKKNDKKTSTRYTIRDSQESFLFIGKSLQEVEDHISHLRKVKKSTQPFIYGVGENIFSLSEITVYFDGIRYKFKNFIRAVDICFKLIYLFNLEFPPESIMFYNFLEIFFYFFEPKNVSTRVHVIIDALKNVTSQLNMRETEKN
ncbi:uncharacterized protein LOC116167315 [Photinus pyralis]|uniref:uncharacterized protein LOC116167315 n=1 Tax=Photinus pyralis TaxID=7054 RepID=UPI001266E629|nr:uncharacterized protein LOC116167315 [Photinus pyralis]